MGNFNVFNFSIKQSKIVSIVTIIEFFKYRTYITSKIISETYTEFPAVTICNLNQIDITAQEFTGDLVNEILIQNNINASINASNETASY